MRRSCPSVSSKWAVRSPVASSGSAVIATIPPACFFAVIVGTTWSPGGLYYLPDVRSIIQEEMSVPHTPSVQAMMTRDVASRGLGIELVDQGDGRAVTD